MDQLACKNDIIRQFAAAKVDVDDDSDANMKKHEIIFQKMKNTYLLVILIPMQRLFLVSSLFMSKKNNDCDSAKMVKLLFWYFFFLRKKSF